MPRRAIVLLISQEDTLVKMLGRVVQSIRNLQLEAVPTIEATSRWLPQPQVALVLAHLVGERITSEGARLLRKVAQARLPLATLVLSNQPGDRAKRRLLRLGAADYLAKPFDFCRLSHLIEILSASKRLAARQGTALQKPADMVCMEGNGDGEPFFYSPSAGMGQIMEQIKRVAQQDITVLLCGETGTGKTRLARMIHDRSPRRDEPFLVVNCGALSPTLIESEMFGHVKGAFTGADYDRAGKFAQAGRGTLLLDEIDSLPLSLQCKLLRAVEERVFEPVGSDRLLPLSARLIVTSSQPLEQQVAAGQFRSDLFFRLNIVGLYLPPLRERLFVLEPLVRHLITRFATTMGRPVTGISAPALLALQEYPWPGNFRELRNVIEGTVALCPGPEIQLEDLPQSICNRTRGPGLAGFMATSTYAVGPNGVSGATSAPASPSQATLDQTKDEVEAAHIRAALERNKHNRSRTATELGISRVSLYNKLHQYRLFRPKYRISSSAGNGEDCSKNLTVETPQGRETA